MKVGHCEWKDQGVIVEFSTLPSKASAMANRTCRTCDRAADAGAYCSSCAAGIMAKALNPFHGRRRKKLPERTRRLSPGPPATCSAQQRLFG